MQGTAPPTMDDLLGTINALPTVWKLLLAPLSPDVAASARVHLDRTLERLGGLTPTGGRNRGLAGADADGDALAKLLYVARNAAAASRSLHQAARTELHDAVAEDVHDAGRAVAAAGEGVPDHVGAVASVNVSDGGVPKRPVDVAAIGPRGLVTDAQSNRRHHGKPMQAVCLYSAEVIAALQEEGHPIAAGAAGENLTVRGLDWAALRPGVLLRVGSALLETSAPAVPCAKNAAWFVDGDVRRMDHDRHPGWSRWYAWVRQPGEVRPGDAVAVEP